MSLTHRLRDIFERFSRAVFLLGGVVILVWFVFFDSYNLITRIQLHREKSELRSSNEAMESRIAELRQRVDEGLTDEDIERIAREEYGMSREDETVYPLIEE